ncbi:MAG: amidohydrolase family protein [Candidatus Korobacteraceae bacterium]
MTAKEAASGLPRVPEQCQGPNPDLTPPKFVAPPGTCDCAVHVVGPFAQFPLMSNRKVTPPEATAEDYRRVMAALRIERAVVAQPSFYGTDNRCVREAILASNGAWRGVAVIDPEISESELLGLHQAGFCGVRINLLMGGGPGLDGLDRIAERIRHLSWHLQLFLDAHDLPKIAQRLRRLPVPLVIDHMGYAPPAEGTGQPGFQTLLHLAREGCWVKLSAAYRISAQPYPYEDVVPLVRALVEAAPSRMLWGTDWPHPAFTALMPRDGDLLDLLPSWIPDDGIQKRVLVDNPAALYGFAPQQFRVAAERPGITAR